MSIDRVKKKRAAQQDTHAARLFFVAVDGRAVYATD